MPKKSLVSKKEMSAPGFKVSKSRITAMVCGNKSGTHRLPLLIIGKSKKPRSFKGIVTLPVVYEQQKNSWMDTSIFVDWYDTVFTWGEKAADSNWEHWKCFIAGQ